ncbi:hypothetical protein M2480_002251 [Parabacteroides sp. PFB2-12]|nr:hypothetical protein [Parabacteroides sp. PM6-13]MDH6391260.1 hypothetical protein [Parabacteroides sp. PFB2-12]
MESFGNQPLFFEGVEANVKNQFLSKKAVLLTISYVKKCYSQD